MTREVAAMQCAMKAFNKRGEVRDGDVVDVGACVDRLDHLLADEAADEDVAEHVFAVLNAVGGATRYAASSGRRDGVRAAELVVGVDERRSRAGEEGHEGFALFLDDFEKFRPYHRA